MQQAELVITGIGQLVTCAADGRGPKRGAQMRDVNLIENASVAISDGIFVAVGPHQEVLVEFIAERTFSAEGRAACPGFVDPHTHIVYAGDRLDEFVLKLQGAEYLDILAAGGGILSTVNKTREASVDLLVDESLDRLNKMFKAGTTTIEIKTGYGLDTKTELKMLQVIERLDDIHEADIVPTFLAAHTIAPEFRNDPEAYVSLIREEMLPAAWNWYLGSKFYKKGTPFFCDVFAERNAFDVEQMGQIFATAGSLGFRLKSHVDQFSNLGGSEVSIRNNAVSIDHLDSISEREVGILAESDTIGVVIPTENFSAGKVEFAPARRLIDRGCAVALSTDFNPGSAPCPSMPMSMAIASRYQRLLPSEALNAATINAAHAVGLGDKVGSIEVGKAADMLILGCMDHRQIVYEFGGNLVLHVIKRGKFTSND